METKPRELSHLKPLTVSVGGPPKLVDAAGLLQSLFEESARPSLRWVRDQQKRRTIPVIKIGHLVRFDVESVRRALAEQFTVQAKGGVL